MSVKLLSVTEIGLSVRASNILQRYKIHTVGEMLQLTEETVYGYKNAGKKTVEEILSKIEKYKKIDQAGSPAIDQEQLDAQMPENYEQWLTEETGKTFLSKYLENTGIEALELLSAKAFNLLSMNGYEKMSQVVFLTVEDLMQIRRMDQKTAEEIIRNCRYYLNDNKTDILAAYAEVLIRNGIATDDPAEENASHSEPISIRKMIYDEKYRKEIRTYVEANDCFVEQMGLAIRSQNRLLGVGVTKMSELILIPEHELREIKHLGKKSFDEINAKIEAYISEHEHRIRAVVDGDMSALYKVDNIMDMILKLYLTEGFKGLSFSDIKEKLQLPEVVTDQQLKSAIGKLLAAKELIYVDFRCYRVYKKFAEYLASTELDERTKRVMTLRLQGKTLEEVGKIETVTRERIRQIEGKGKIKLRERLMEETGTNHFDEDYYQYLFDTYDLVKEDAAEWFGISAETWSYLSTNKRGPKPLNKALEDAKLSAGMRLKIRNYLNRNKLYIDGVWVEKKRAVIEDVVLKKYCQDEKTFDEFVEIYNNFLKENEIEFTPDLYITSDAYSTRKNRLLELKDVLYRTGGLIRYYDIAGTDFTELLDVLNLDAYEDRAISTSMFMEEYPEIMKKYDIRHEHELHNLLRKIIKPGSYHDIAFGRMPTITFGNYDRPDTMLDVLLEHAPIKQADYLDLICKEYGYDRKYVAAHYLPMFAKYLHEGVYSLDQKVMSTENRNLFRQALTEDFYYFDELRSVFKKILPDADIETVNPYNLKMMGGLVISNYVIFNHSTTEGYISELLKQEDIFDITPYRERYGRIASFVNIVIAMRHNREIIEFEKNKMINIRRLNNKGISREMLQDFCDRVYEYVQDEEFFSIQSLREAGFEDDMYSNGLGDWFLGSLLSTDDRFSWTYMYGNIILKKYSGRIAIKDLLLKIIKKERIIDTYDLMNILEHTYGCTIQNRSDVLGKLSGTTVYHDKILDRLYITEDEYYRELEEMEGI